MRNSITRVSLYKNLQEQRASPDAVEHILTGWAPVVRAASSDCWWLLSLRQPPPATRPCLPHEGAEVFTVPWRKIHVRWLHSGSEGMKPKLYSWGENLFKGLTLTACLSFIYRQGEKPVTTTVAWKPKKLWLYVLILHCWVKMPGTKASLYARFSLVLQIGPRDSRGVL